MGRYHRLMFRHLIDNLPNLSNSHRISLAVPKRGVAFRSIQRYDLHLLALKHLKSSYWSRKQGRFQDAYDQFNRFLQCVRAGLCNSHLACFTCVSQNLRFALSENRQRPMWFSCLEQGAWRMQVRACGLWCLGRQVRCKRYFW